MGFLVKPRCSIKVLLLGRGILGSAVANHFTRLGYDLTVMTDRYTAESAKDYLAKVESIPSDWIINAVGRIPMRKAPLEELRSVNVDLPLQVKGILRREQKMIQMSSDAVFGGSKGFEEGYRWDEPMDPIDDYGRSKRDSESCAEVGRCWVVRSSLIGWEERTGAGLMGWYWSQKESATGYRNHLWNGNTSLELAKVFDELIQGKILNPEPILQVGYLPAISKFQLLELIRENSGRGVPVTAGEGALALNRTLIPNVIRNSIEVQLKEFFYSRNKGKS